MVARLRAAGAVLVGRTNLSEFAFHGLGTNPHYGTPRNPADRTRVPGGSSSGAAVSVAEAMCAIGIGSDTAGSVRIPAAFCGLVGFKPTQERIPRTGVFPLLNAQSLNSCRIIPNYSNSSATTPHSRSGCPRPSLQQLTRRRHDQVDTLSMEVLLHAGWA